MNPPGSGHYPPEFGREAGGRGNFEASKIPRKPHGLSDISPCFAGSVFFKRRVLDPWQQDSGMVHGTMT